MKRSFWAALVLAAACGGKTIEDPPVIDQPDPGPGKQLPPVPIAGSANVGGAPMMGSGGATVAGGYPAYGGTVGIGGSIAIGGADGTGGGLPFDALDAATYHSCNGVALLSREGWVDGPQGPEEIFVTAQGDWVGWVYSIWGNWQVEMHLMPDQSYSAVALSGSGPALYYGTDLDSPLKQWRITDSAVIGAQGEIEVIFWDPGEMAHEGYQGWLDCMHLNDSLQRLRFEFWYDGADYMVGPFVFELYRF